MTIVETPTRRVGPAVAGPGSLRWWPHLPGRLFSIHEFWATRTPEYASVCLGDLFRRELLPGEGESIPAATLEPLARAVSSGEYVDQVGRLALILCCDRPRSKNTDNWAPPPRRIGVWTVPLTALPPFEHTLQMMSGLARRFRRGKPHPKAYPFFLLQGRPLHHHFRLR